MRRGGNCITELGQRRDPARTSYGVGMSTMEIEKAAGNERSSITSLLHGEGIVIGVSSVAACMLIYFGEWGFHVSRHIPLDLIYIELRL